jgi:hypothetical protein
MTIVATEMAKIDTVAAGTDQHKAALAKQIDEWTKTAARYRSEPEAGGGKGEGTQELSRRAQEMEKVRDHELNKYHNFEFASAAFQIGIVLASAAVITGIITLAYAAIGVGLIGVVLTGTGLFMPELLHNVLHWFEALFAGGGHH